jgi:hypothetical protein
MTEPREEEQRPRNATTLLENLVTAQKQSSKLADWHLDRIRDRLTIVQLLLVVVIIVLIVIASKL